MAVKPEKPVADIIDLNASRAEKHTAINENSAENISPQESVDDNRGIANEQIIAPVSKKNVGEILAQTRQAAGLTLPEIVSATKIKQAHLEAIEDSNLKELPALPFTVGFVKVYAGFLNLDAEELAKQFKIEVSGNDVVAEAAVVREPLAAHRESEASFERSGATSWASIVGIAAIAVFAIWVTMQILGGPSRGDQSSDKISNDQNAAPSIVVSETPIEKIDAPTASEDVVPAVVPAEVEETSNLATDQLSATAVEQFQIEEAQVEASQADEARAPEADVVTDVSATDDLDTADLATTVFEDEAVVTTTTEAPFVEEEAPQNLAAALNASSSASLSALDDASDVDGVNIASINASSEIVVDDPEGLELESDLLTTEVVPVPSLQSQIPVIRPSALNSPEAFNVAELATPNSAAELNAQQVVEVIEVPTEEIAPPPAVVPSVRQPVIVKARIVKQITPDYPARCDQKADENERVQVVLNVDVQGKPRDARVLNSSNSCFNRSAVNAARKMKFVPQTADGAAQAESGRVITFNFAK